jgi:hypothetical protein
MASTGATENQDKYCKFRTNMMKRIHGMVLKKAGT